MIKKEERKVYYTDEIIVDVSCDMCGRSLIGDFDTIFKLRVDEYTYLPNKRQLSSMDYQHLNLDMCEDCYNNKVQSIILNAINE